MSSDELIKESVAENISMNSLKRNTFKKHIRVNSCTSNLTNFTSKASDEAENKVVDLGEDSKLMKLFDELRSRGALDTTLETKMNDYKSNISSNSNNFDTHNDNNISMKLELSYLNKSFDNSLFQLNNLHSILKMKEKKLEILENAHENLTKKITTEKPIELVNKNSFKRKKNHSLDMNCLNDTASTTKNSFYEKDDELESLKNELENIKNHQTKQIDMINNNFIKRKQIEINNEKIKNGEILKDISNDNYFLLNNLHNEINFLKNKIKNKEENFIDVKIYNEEVKKENINFNNKKMVLMDKLNNLKRAIEAYNYQNTSLTNSNNPKKTLENVQQQTIISNLNLMDQEYITNLQEQEILDENMDTVPNNGINTLLLNYELDHNAMKLVKYFY